MLPLIATPALLFDKCYPASSRQVFKWKVTAPVCEAPGGPSRFALRELPAEAARQPPPEDTSLRISDGHSRFGAPVTTTDHNCRPIPSTCQAPINFFPFLRTSRFGTAPDRALLLPPTGSSAKNGPKGTSRDTPILRTLKARILTAQLWFAAAWPRYPAGAAHVAGPQLGRQTIAFPAEQGQQMIAGGLQVSVPSALLLLPVNRNLGAKHVQHHSRG